MFRNTVENNAIVNRYPNPKANATCPQVSRRRAYRWLNVLAGTPEHVYAALATPRECSIASHV